MLCKKPYTRGPQQFGCGQCMPCRVNRSRLWIARMMLEALEYEERGEESAFVTLTYDAEHVPPDGSLRPLDLRVFLNRLRGGR